MGKASIYFLQSLWAKEAKEKDCDWHSRGQRAPGSSISSLVATLKAAQLILLCSRAPVPQFAPPKCNSQAFSFVKVSVWNSPRPPRPPHQGSALGRLVFSWWCYFKKFWKLWEVELGWRKRTKLSTPDWSGWSGLLQWMSHLPGFIRLTPPPA